MSTNLIKGKATVKKITLGLGIFLGLLFLFYFILNLYLNIFSWIDVKNELRTKDTPFYLVNIVIFIGAIITAAFSWWRNSISKEQVEQQIEQNKILLEQIKNAQEQTKNLIEQTRNSQTQTQVQIEQRLDSLFVKAVEFFKEGSDLVTRRSGVHILKDLAITSPLHTQKCIDVLCSINSTWMPYVLNKNKDFFSDSKIDWMNNTITNTDLINYGVDNPDDSFLPNRVMLSQDVNRTLSFIFKYVNNNEKFNEIYDLSNKYLCTINLSSLSFEKFNIDNAFFIGAEIHHCNFDDLQMNKTNFYDSNLEYSTFNGAILNFVNFEKAILFRTQFSTSSIGNSNFNESKLMFSIFQSAYLLESDFNGADIQMAKFQLTEIHECNFLGTNLKESIFECTIVDACKYLATNLFGCHFQGAEIKHSEFTGSNLDSARFEGANIRDCNFTLSILYDCVLYGAKISLSGKYSIFGDNSFEPIATIFDLDSHKFKEKIEGNARTYIRELSQNSYVEKMMSAYSVFHANKNTNFGNIFNSISSANEKILKSRVDLGVSDIYIAEGLLRFKKIDEVVDQANTMLIDKIRSDYRGWWNIFILKGIFNK